MISEDVKIDIKSIVVGSAIFNILVLAILFLIFCLKKIFIYDFLTFSIGTIIGFLITIFMAIHMANTFDRVLYFNDEKNARTFLIKRNLFRYMLIVIVVLLVSYFLSAKVAIFIIVGIFGLKFGAYMNPIIKKILYKKI